MNFLSDKSKKEAILQGFLMGFAAPLFMFNTNPYSREKEAEYLKPLDYVPSHVQAWHEVGGYLRGAIKQVDSELQDNRL